MRKSFLIILGIAVLQLLGCHSTSTCVPRSRPPVGVCTDDCMPRSIPDQPAVVQVIGEYDRLRAVIFSDRCFEPELTMPNTPRIKAVCAVQLVQVANLFKRNPYRYVWVRGYTDNIPDPETACINAQRQADVITAFLWSRGISVRRLQTQGHGASCFISSYRNVTVNSNNRRVEIVMQY